MDAIILAGGLGTRLASVTQGAPKVLAPVSGLPFIDHLIRHLKEQGLRRLIMCVGAGGQSIERALGCGDKFGIQLEYAYDGPPDSGQALGTAYAVRNACSTASDSFLLINGDTFVPDSFSPVVRLHIELRGAPVIGVYRNDNKHWCSNVALDGQRVVKYSKGNPTLEMRYVDVGVGVFRREDFRTSVFHHLPDFYEELSMSNKLFAVEFPSRFFEINTPESLAETEQYLDRRVR